VHPDCSRRIQRKRTSTLADALTVAPAAVHFTLTQSHQLGEALAVVWDHLTAASSGFTGGEAFKRLRTRFGIEVVVRTTEVVYTRAGGWHPHQHLVLLLAHPLIDTQHQQLGEALAERWRVASAPVGRVADQLKAEPHTGRPWRAARYLFKVSTDRGHKLDALTTGDLLVEAFGGDAEARKLWAEFEQAQHGRQAFSARGLRNYITVHSASHGVRFVDSGSNHPPVAVDYLQAVPVTSQLDTRGSDMTGTDYTAENSRELVAILRTLPGLPALDADTSRDAITAQLTAWAAEPGHADEARAAFATITADPDHARVVGLDLLEIFWSAA
jgi:hypothetical protein